MSRRIISLAAAVIGIASIAIISTDALAFRGGGRGAGVGHRGAGVGYRGVGRYYS